MGCCKKSKTKPKMTREELNKYSQLTHLLVEQAVAISNFHYYKYSKFVDETGIDSKYSEATAAYGEEEEEKLIKHLKQTAELLHYLIATLEKK